MLFQKTCEKNLVYRVYSALFTVSFSLFTFHCPLEKSFPILYKGWKSKSGKKRLTSIKIPAVMLNQTAAKIGAEERNLGKPCMEYSPKNREVINQN
jgi:hypothetical protein